MEVDYSLTLDDALAFRRHYQAHRQSAPPGRSFPWVGWLVCIAAGLLLGVGHSIYQVPFHWLTLAVLFLGVFVGGGITLRVCHANFLSWRLQFEDPRNRAWRGPWRLAISPEGITQTSALERTFKRWDIILWIDTTEEHLFLYDSPYCCMIVPRRAFRDDRHFDEFVDLARRYRDEAKAAGQSHAPVPSSDAITRDLG
jgi:hypothetical protein